MAIILNLETATTNCSVSVCRNGKMLAIKEHDSAQYSHSEQLHNFITDVLNEASVLLAEVDAIAVSMGPGSYTGLRIGVSAAKGLCFSLDIPLIAISTLESMAHQINAAPDELIIPVLDARRMEVYVAVFNHEYHKIQEINAEIINDNSFESLARTNRLHLVGSGAAKCKEVLNNPNINFDATIVPSAREMGMLSYKKFLEGQFENVAYFEPYYLKDFMLTSKK